ncbi:carbohydrate-binding protein [Paenibacillus antri]|uniref:Carbohydrate-binding protein n=2 Tax=Paenibacillus antri TaxID=2582848 RepID=A0A5R9G6E5_9BACL|nr:carbohydrate-binding protein [Paenibacillus antri]
MAVGLLGGALPSGSAAAAEIGEADALAGTGVDNLLANGGFERTETGSGWIDNVKPSAWGQWLASGTPKLAIDSQVYRSGERSASIEGPAGAVSRAAITQSVPVTIGKTYRIGGWVKTEAVSNQALIRFQMRRSGAGNLLINVGTVTGTRDWTYIERLLTIPDNALQPATLAVEMFLEAGTGKVWFDDVSVTEPVQSIAVSPDIAYLEIGETVTPSVTFVPSSATDKRLLWSSSDPETAAVSGDGDIVGLRAGQSVITAKTVDGGHAASISVSVGASDTLEVEAYAGEVPEDGSLTGRLTATDSSGAPIAFALATPPSRGAMTVSDDGSFRYYPNPSFTGTDTFKFTASTGEGGPKFGTGTIAVLETNDAPVLDLEWAYTASGASIAQGLLQKSSDPDGDALTWTVVEPTANGAIAVHANGSYDYAPNAGFTGYDRFRVAAEDGRGGRTERDMLIFVGPTAASAAAALEAHAPARSHPRLLASGEKFAAARALSASGSGDPYMPEWFELLRKQADPVLNTQPLAYSANGGNAYPLRDRLLPTALMYQLTGDDRYAERVWREFDAMADYPDWGGRTNNILALSELSFAVALAYDWIYDYMSEEQRSRINIAIRDNALNVALDWYRGAFRHNGEFNNINLVDNGGLGLLALAVADEPETRDAALEAVQSSFAKLQQAVRHYTADGSWPEGPAYWHYGGQYLAMYMAALHGTLGTDFGLSGLPGYEASGAYPYHLLGEGGVFNFYDGGVSLNMYESIWFAAFFDEPEYAWFIGDLYRRKGLFHPLYMVFYEPGIFEAKPAALDRFFSGIESGSMRSAWDDPYALFASMKGVNETMRSHNDLDAGTFVFDALGVRWAADLGNENYNLPGFWDYNYTRWTYYRKKTEGHNTIVLNPVQNPVVQQEPYGTAVAVRNESKPRGAYTILDMTDLYSKDAGEMLRGMMLTADRTELIVQDEIKLKLPSEVYWFMHTPADIEIVEGGRAALLRSQDKKLYVEMTEAPAGAAFAAMDAAPLPTSPNPEGQSSNEGMRKLAIHMEHVQEATLSIRMVPLYSSDPLPAPAAGAVPLHAWSIPDGELPPVAERVTASDIRLNGEPLAGFDPKVTYYEVALPMDEPSPPTVTATSEHSVTVAQAEALPGAAVVTVSAADGSPRTNRYTIVFARGASVGEPPAHLKYPVASVTASAVPEAANIPENTIDGDLDTRWSASGTQYIQYDLGEPRKIGAVSIAIYSGDTRKNYFDILTSDDAVVWKTVYADGVTSGTTALPETYLVEETTARYVRILGKGNNANAWNSITEVGIYPLAPLIMRVDAPSEMMPGETGTVTARWGYPLGHRVPVVGATYEVDRPDVASVDAAGLLTAKMPGTATLTVTDAVYGFVHRSSVTVLFNGDQPFLRLEGATTMRSKDTQSLTARLLYPDGSIVPAEPHQLRFRSDAPNVVSVDANGTVRANQAGAAVITAVDDDTGAANAIAITVE